MQVLITGNKTYGLSCALANYYPNATFCSRTTGYDLTQRSDQDKFAELALEHDIIINCSALWRFEQTNLLETVWKKCVDNHHYPHIINIGSTTDRVKKGTSWRYNAEKKALRDFSNSLGLLGIWDNKLKISYISFGTLSNKQEKHPDRKCIDINDAAAYIKWLIDQPKYVNINEISIDPMQDDKWYE
jgi:NADP-dependent 3-hydroxy acid dehydrogenase YdfG